MRWLEVRELSKAGFRCVGGVRAWMTGSWRQSEVVACLWRGGIDWKLLWWGVWFDVPMQMDRRYVIRPQPSKDLLEGLVLTECSDEESWRGRMQRDIKDSTLVCRGTGRYGHQTWSATRFKPDEWNLWRCTGGELVDLPICAGQLKCGSVKPVGSSSGASAAELLSAWT